MENSIKFTENVYRTVCPGCNMGCGVYMRELHPENAAPILNIDYRKSAPTNEGKLCRFGVHMTRFYESAVRSMIGGKEANDADAIKAAAESVKAAGDAAAFLSVGSTTNEEHMAFMDLAKAAGVSASLGLSGLYKDIGRLHMLAGRGTTFDDVQNAKKIFLLTDPYVQYPMIMRHLVRAKAKGAEITAFGVKKLPIADKCVFIKPCTSLYEVAEFAPDAETVVISDITPYTNARRLAEILEISKTGGADAKTLFLKPFVNSTGAGHLSRHTKQRSFEEIVSGINDGNIRVLVCLDSDLVNLCLNPEISETLSKLDKLIVFASRKTPVCDMADVVIASEPFYRKEGTVVNAEGRLIPLSAAVGPCPRTGFENISALAAALGAAPRSFEDVSAAVLSEFGVSEVDEFNVPVPEKKAYDGEKISESLDTACPADGEETNAKHIYVTNSFMWAGLSDEDDFIEIGTCFARELKLLKGFTADVTCACGSTTSSTRFRADDVECGYILSRRKQPFAKGPVSKVKIEPTPTKPQ